MDNVISEALAERQETALGSMRESGASVSVRQGIDWSKYAQDGALVSLHIGRWRAETKLNLSDLGIEPETESARKAMERVLNLGTALLLPRRVVKQFGKLHDGARHALEVESLKTMWGRFVPRKNYSAWAERNRRIRDAYLGLALSVAERWEDYKEEMRADFDAIARDSYAKAKRNGMVGEQSEDDFAEAFVGRMLRKMPTAERFVQSVSFVWDAEYIPVGGMAPVGDSADALMSDVMETASRKAAEGLARFVEDIQTDIRSRIVEACDGALAALRGEERENGKVAKTGVRGLKAMVERVSALKFWEDAELEAQLARIAALAEAPKATRQDASLETLLVQVSAESRLILDELPRETRRASKEALEAPAESEEMVKPTTRRASKGNALGEDGEAPMILKRSGRKGKTALVA